VGRDVHPSCIQAEILAAVKLATAHEDYLNSARPVCGTCWEAAFQTRQSKKNKVCEHPERLKSKPGVYCSPKTGPPGMSVLWDDAPNHERGGPSHEEITLHCVAGCLCFEAGHSAQIIWAGIVWPPFSVAGLPSRCDSGFGFRFAFFSSVMFRLASISHPGVPTVTRPQGSSTELRTNRPLSRSASLLTSRRSSNHMKVAVKRLPSTVPGCHALFVAAPSPTD
jgi:hypothetical protein